MDDYKNIVEQENQTVMAGSRLAFCQGLGSHLKIINDVIEQGLDHSDTIVPLIPLRFHSSSMRFSAARLISNERLKRAIASSYVIFFFSIITVYLTIVAAK